MPEIGAGFIETSNAIRALIWPLLGPPLLGLEFGDIALLYVVDDKEVSVKSAGQAQRQRGLGVEEDPATLLPARDVVNCDGRLNHALKSSPSRSALGLQLLIAVDAGTILKLRPGIL